MRNWWQRFRRWREWEEEELEEKAVRPRHEYNRQLAAKKRIEKEQELLFQQRQQREAEARQFLKEKKEEQARKALLAGEKLAKEAAAQTKNIENLENQLQALLVLIEREEGSYKKDAQGRNFEEGHLVEGEESRQQDALLLEDPFTKASIERRLEEMKKEEGRE